MNSQQIKQLADFLEEYIEKNTKVDLDNDPYQNCVYCPSAKDIELVLLKWMIDNTKS